MPFLIMPSFLLWIRYKALAKGEKNPLDCNIYVTEITAKISIILSVVAIISNYKDILFQTLNVYNKAREIFKDKFSWQTKNLKNEKYPFVLESYCC